MEYELVGGPFNGKKVELSSPSSMVFRVGEEAGRYAASYMLPHELREEAIRQDMKWCLERDQFINECEVGLLHWQPVTRR